MGWKAKATACAAAWVAAGTVAGVGAYKGLEAYETGEVQAITASIARLNDPAFTVEAANELSRDAFSQAQFSSCVREQLPKNFSAATYEGNVVRSDNGQPDYRINRAEVQVCMGDKADEMRARETPMDMSFALFMAGALAAACSVRRRKLEDQGYDLPPAFYMK